MYCEGGVENFAVESNVAVLLRAIEDEAGFDFVVSVGVLMSEGIGVLFL